MGKIVAKIKLMNSFELEAARRGLMKLEDVQSAEVEALVDTGATTLVLPADLVAALGLRELRSLDACLADGSTRSVPFVTGLFIELLGREMACDALVMPPGSKPLIGQIPLEALDLVLEPKSRRLVVNPASPDTPRLDVLGAA
jgi:clan AA aspartic protease